MSLHHRSPVVCGVDGSASSLDAARAAVHAAARRDVPLHLVRAFCWPVEGVPGLPPAVDGRAAARRAAAAELARLLVRVAGWDPGCRVTAEVVDGLPDLVLDEAAGEAGLLVVGAHGHSGPAGPAVGSVATAVARSATCPVLVHRPSAALAPVRHGVVVGVDGGPTSVGLLAAAATEAELARQPLQVLHGWRGLSSDAGEALRYRVDAHGVASSELRDLAGAVAAVRIAHPGLDVEVVVDPGRAGALLAHASRTAWLVVVGRHGSTGPDLLHTTTRTVLQRAGAPVLVVPLPIAPQPADLVGQRGTGRG